MKTEVTLLKREIESVKDHQQEEAKQPHSSSPELQTRLTQLALELNSFRSQNEELVRELN